MTDSGMDEGKYNPAEAVWEVVIVSFWVGFAIGGIVLGLIGWWLF